MMMTNPTTSRSPIEVRVPGTIIDLGTVFEFEVVGNSLVECTVFVRHWQIQYLEPIAKLSVFPSTVRFFPEAPGNYTLIIHFRTLSGTEASKEIAFKVRAGKDFLFQPQHIRLGDIALWVPSQWEQQLMSSHEADTLERILKKVERGWVVYDLGANLGYYSIFFARSVGPQGHVFCIEANPVCIYFLQANLAANHIENSTVLPIAVAKQEELLQFKVNYASSGLGITQASNFYTSKIGHEVLVKATSLDELISQYHLRPPNLIKIDVEGDEYFVASGMNQILHNHRPILLVEIHGIESATHTLPLLERHNYVFEYGGKIFPSAEQFLDNFSDRVVQVICQPK
ncbi:MAG: FkbM family methyltransferase [Candidatus Bilamarchaeaceae archaeon]